jgi:hypothetical protein
MINKMFKLTLSLKIKNIEKFHFKKENFLFIERRRKKQSKIVFRLLLLNCLFVCLFVFYEKGKIRKRKKERKAK